MSFARAISSLRASRGRGGLLLPAAPATHSRRPERIGGSRPSGARPTAAKRPVFLPRLRVASPPRPVRRAGLLRGVAG